MATVDPAECPAGRYGNALGLTNPACSGSCPAGKFCPQPTETTGFECGGVKFYCPEGSDTPQEAVAGQYTVTGPVRNREDVRQCDPGYYCDGSGVRAECPAGQYGSSHSLSSPTCDGPCAAGYTCPARSVVSTAVECGGVSVFCPEGSFTASNVSFGFYSAPEDVPVTTRTHQLQCDPGHYCIDGERFACAAGTWSADVGRSTPCTASCQVRFVLVAVGCCWLLLAAVGCLLSLLSCFFLVVCLEGGQGFC